MQPNDIFYFYKTSVGDLTRYINKFAINGLQPVEEYIVNCFGVKIRKRFFPNILGKMPDCVEGKPIPSNWHTDIAETGAVLRAVDLANDTFTMIELGCGWGTWLNIAGKVAKDRSLKVRLYGVEGDAGHVQFAEQARVDNGFQPNEFTIINGVASALPGFALFPQQDRPGVTWGEEPIFNADQKQATAAAANGFRAIPQIQLAQIAGYGVRIDLLHMDIQGGEWELVCYSLDYLAANVAMMFIGTHSRVIEGRLIDCLSTRGWRLEVERPAILNLRSGGINTAVDGCQLWRNPLFISDREAQNGEPIGKISVREAPQSAIAGQKFNLQVTVANESDTDWKSASTFPCRMSYHWLRLVPDKDQIKEVMYVYDGLRTNFKDNLLPAKTVSNETMNVMAPDKPGTYKLVLTIVLDGIKWFEKSQTFKSAEHVMQVVE